MMVTGVRAVRGSGQSARYGTRPDRSIDCPSLTVRASGGGSAPFGFVFNIVDSDGSESRVKLTDTQGAVLQTYPSDFAWVGGSVKQQVGNAVPPLQAKVVLSSLWTDKEEQ